MRLISIFFFENIGHFTEFGTLGALHCDFEIAVELVLIAYEDIISASLEEAAYFLNTHVVKFAIEAVTHF